MIEGLIIVLALIIIGGYAYKHPIEDDSDELL
jgi:hypothetical protein